jgi:hypothetical protein
MGGISAGMQSAARICPEQCGHCTELRA